MSRTKSLSEKQIEEMRHLRSEGTKQITIARQFKVSPQTVRNYTTDIAPPPKVVEHIGAIQSNIMDKARAAKIDAEVEELTNEVRKKRLKLELDELETRSGLLERERELRVREKELESRISQGSQGATEIQELRHELSELREARFQSEIARRDAEIADLRRMIMSGREVETRWGAFAKAIDKADSQMSGLRSDIKNLYLSQSHKRAELPPLSEEERKGLGEKIKKAVQKEQESRRLAQELWPEDFGYPPQNTVVTKSGSPPKQEKQEQKREKPECFRPLGYTWRCASSSKNTKCQDCQWI